MIEGRCGRAVASLFFARKKFLINNDAGLLGSFNGRIHPDPLSPVDSRWRRESISLSERDFVSRRSFWHHLGWFGLRFEET
jgi:hypothetical protein